MLALSESHVYKMVLEEIILRFKGWMLQWRRKGGDHYMAQAFSIQMKKKKRSHELYFLYFIFW